MLPRTAAVMVATVAALQMGGTVMAAKILQISLLAPSEPIRKLDMFTFMNSPLCGQNKDGKPGNAPAGPCHSATACSMATRKQSANRTPPTLVI